MKIREITFGFENTEQITINGKYIGEFLIQDIERVVQRTACNSIDEMQVAHTVMIEIHKDANKEYVPFDFYENDKCKVFDRFLGKDVTDLTVSMYDAYGNKPENKYKFFTWWKGDNDYTNEAQSIYFNTSGHMYFMISDGKNVLDFLDINDLENPAIVDLRFSMYDYGGIENITN